MSVFVQRDWLAVLEVPDGENAARAVTAADRGEVFPVRAEGELLDWTRFTFESAPSVFEGNFGLGVFRLARHRPPGRLALVVAVLADQHEGEGRADLTLIRKPPALHRSVRANRGQMLAIGTERDRPMATEFARFLLFLEVPQHNAIVGRRDQQRLLR